MPVTVNSTVALLVNRLRGKIAAVNQSCPGVTLSAVPNATNPDFVDAVRKALLWVGISPADPTTVVDADLTPLAGFRCEKFYDAATLEGLYTCLGACNVVDEVVGENQQKLSQVEAGVQKMIAMVEERLRMPYGPNVQTGAMGAMKAGSNGFPNDPLNPCQTYTGPFQPFYPPQGPINP